MGILKLTGARGISAPQIGFPVQFCLVRLEDGMFQDLINPLITAMYGVETYENESCLSLPPGGNTGRTPRMQIIEVSTGVPTMRFMMRFKGRNSRMVQHEVDHLNRTMFTDRMPQKERDEVMERYTDWKRDRKMKGSQ